MAEFQWWLLIVGLVAGGSLVAVVTMSGRRREEDLDELERRAEATWIAGRLGGDPWSDADTVDSILRLHDEYLSMPAPDRLVVEPGEPAVDAASDGDADGPPDDIRDGRGGDADRDLAGAGEQQPATGQEAHAGADREQRHD